MEAADHEALFVRAGRSISRKAGLVDAYRRGSGLLLICVRTDEAARRLAEIVETCRRRGASSVAESADVAGRLAMCAYLGTWWRCALVDEPPQTLGPGDEWFSKAQVREMVEGRVSPSQRVGDEVVGAAPRGSADARFASCSP